MEVETQRYLRHDQTSNRRSFGSINHPSSQPRKISIGIMVDPLAKEKSRVTKEGEVVLPNAQTVKSNVGSTILGKNREEEVIAATKTKQTKDPEQPNSPRMSTASLYQEMPNSINNAHATQSSNLPSVSGKQYKLDGAKNAPLAYSVQHFSNQTMLLEAGGKKQKNSDGVAHQKRGVKHVGAAEVQDFTFETPREKVIMSDKEVLVNKIDAPESRRTETLRVKLWEILGNASQPNDQNPVPQPHEVGDDDLNPEQEFDQMDATVGQPKQNSDKAAQKSDLKGDAFIKSRQNSDTIEMDSESPDNIFRRPVTRSMSRKRAPPRKQQKTAKNGPSSGYKLEHRETTIYSFEQELCEKVHGSSTGGSSRSMQKKRGNKRFRTESHGIGLPEKDKATTLPKAFKRSEAPSPVKQATSLGKKRGGFHGCLLENERQDLEREKKIQEEVYQSPLKMKNLNGGFANPANNDQPEDIGNTSLKNDTSAEDDYPSPTFGIKTPTSSSPSSLPNSDQMVDVTSPEPCKRRFTVGENRSFQTSWTSKQDYGDNGQVESSDAGEELKDSQLRKSSPDMDENDEEDRLLLSSSEERDLGSREEGTEGDNWIAEPSEPTEMDGLARAVELLALELDKLKTKMKLATNRKSSEILMSVAADVHKKLQNAESQIQADVGKLTNLSKSKRKRLETRFEDQQEQLKVIYEKFKEQVNHHLQDCRSTLEGLEVFQREFKGTVEKQKASHKKLLLQAEEDIETQLSDAQKRIQVIQEMARGKMIQLKQELALCLK